MKKIVALVFAVLLIFALAACGNNAAPPAEPADDGTKAPAPAESGGDKVRLTFSFWGGEDELKATTEMLNLYNSTQDGVEVVPMQIPWETYDEQLNVMATGNELPDAGMMKEQSVIAWAEQGMLMNVSDMYAGEAAPLDSLRFMYQGQTVAYSVCSNILALWYNIDMFDKAGVEYPPLTADKAWTWDQFIDVAKQLTFDANGKTPNDAGFDKNNIVQYGCMVENLTWQLEQWCVSNGSGFISADGTKVIVTDPAAIEAIQAVADLHLVHNVAPLSTGLTDDGVQRSLLAGTCAMTTNGTWAIGAFLSGPDGYGSGAVNYGMGVMPYMKDKVAMSTAGPAVVFSQTKYPDETMEFIKWYTNPENNWGLFGLGIWCPPLQSYYSEPALKDKWLGGQNFPPREMSEAILVDYQMGYAKSVAWYYSNNMNDFLDLLGSVLGDVWTGTKTADEAITAAADQLAAAHKGF